MYCFASENPTCTGTWRFGVGSWKSLKGQENLLLKNLQVKTRVENVRFLSWRIFFVGKYGIQSTNEIAFKRTVTLRASFLFPAIRFDAPTLLSFSRFTHAHAKCPPVFLRETVFNSIAFLDNLRMNKTNINSLVQSIERSLHLIHRNRCSIKQYQFQNIGLNFYTTWFKETLCTAPICVRRRLRLCIHHLDGHYMYSW